MNRKHKQSVIFSIILFIFLLCIVLNFGLSAQEKSPVEVIDKEIEAYNKRDLKAFVSTYSPDAKIYLFPDSLLMSGHEQIRKRYKSRFDNSPNLHCEITNRIVHGNFVIDHEKITGIQEGAATAAVLIYEVKDGLIRKAWIVRK